MRQTQNTESPFPVQLTQMGEQTRHLSLAKAAL